MPGTASQDLKKNREGTGIIYENEFRMNHKRVNLTRYIFSLEPQNSLTPY